MLLLTLIVAPNLSADIVNGSFTAGNTGFSSGYVYRHMGPVQPGDYTIDDDPDDDGYNSSWISFGDHTTGTGNMMIVNGSLSGGTMVWQGQNDSVLAPGTYTFSAWVASLVGPTPIPAILAFSVGSQSLGTFTAPTQAGVWQQFQSTFSLDASGTPYFSVADTVSGVDAWNDFALDDIHLEQVTAPDGGMTLILLGGALFGIESLRRRLRV